MGREVMFAGGYARPYTNDADEMKASDLNDWYPSSVDFKATADGSGGGASVSSLADILKILAGKGDGSVDELGIIGHADSSVFGLGGTIVAPTATSTGNVTFDSAKLIDTTIL